MEKPQLSHWQKVGRGFCMAMLGIAAGLAAFAFALPSFGGLVPAGNDAASRLAFGVHWLFPPAFMLLAGVVAAARRGIYADAIDGTRTPANHGLEINLRYNLNTLEQLVVAAVAWMQLSVMLPLEQLAVIPLLATLFCVGRITFWIGYLINPTGRAFGMALTAAPTLAAYVWIAARWLPA